MMDMKAAKLAKDMNLDSLILQSANANDLALLINEKLIELLQTVASSFPDLKSSALSNTN